MDPGSLSKRLKCASLPSGLKYFPLCFPQEISLKQSVIASVKFEPRALQLWHFIFMI